jgi:hypothetical protein
MMLEYIFLFFPFYKQETEGTCKQNNQQKCAVEVCGSALPSTFLHLQDMDLDFVLEQVLVRLWNAGGMHVTLSLGVSM